MRTEITENGSSACVHQCGHWVYDVRAHPRTGKVQGV